MTFPSEMEMLLTGREVEFNTNSESRVEKSDNWDLSLWNVCLVTYETQLDTDIPLEVKNDKSDKAWRQSQGEEALPTSFAFHDSTPLFSGCVCVWLCELVATKR